jgi:hypothetical protein
MSTNSSTGNVDLRVLAAQTWERPLASSLSALRSQNVFAHDRVQPSVPLPGTLPLCKWTVD